MWFKEEIGRARLFCDIHLTVSNECCTLWEFAIQLETGGLLEHRHIWVNLAYPCQVAIGKSELNR